MITTVRPLVRQPSRFDTLQPGIDLVQSTLQRTKRSIIEHRNHPKFRFSWDCANTCENLLQDIAQRQTAFPGLRDDHDALLWLSRALRSLNDVFAPRNNARRMQHAA